MRIVITGTAGRIGKAIYVRLMPYHSVVGVDKAVASTVDVVGDINDTNLLQRVCGDADAIIHTAALHAPHVGIIPDVEFERVNVEATARLIDVAIRCQVRRIIFTSTTALYGAFARSENAAVWIDENSEPNPLTIYHRTKLSAEALLKTAVDNFDRIHIMRMSRCFPEPAPDMALYRLYRGIDARDVAEAHALAVESNSTGCSTSIVSGTTPFIKDDCFELWSDAPSVLRRRAPELVQRFAERGWQLPHRIDRVYDSHKTQQILGWQPRYGPSDVLYLFDQGLSEVLPAQRFSG